MTFRESDMGKALKLSKVSTAGSKQKKYHPIDKEMPIRGFSVPGGDHFVECMHDRQDFGGHYVCVKCRKHFYKFPLQFYYKNHIHPYMIIPYAPEHYKLLNAAGLCDAECCRQSMRSQPPHDKYYSCFWERFHNFLGF